MLSESHILILIFHEKMSVEKIVDFIFGISPFLFDFIFV